MPEHPIESLMKTAMESIRGMVDVNTVVGDPVETPDGTIIIPISRVAVGFAAGGSEFEIENGENKTNNKNNANAGEGGGSGESQLPFGGGSGAGLTVNPMGFLVVNSNRVRLIPVDKNVLTERLIDMAPELIDQIQAIFDKDGSGKILQGKDNQAGRRQPVQ